MEGSSGEERISRERRVRKARGGGNEQEEVRR